MATAKAVSMGDMRVRFLVNKVSKRIMYMEAGKDLVDMLLGFLQLPVATILSIFAENDTTLKVGSISSVYESLQKLSDACLVVSKDAIMNPPCTLKLNTMSPQLLLPAAPVDAPTLPTKVYRCSSCNSLRYVSWVSGEICPDCTRSNSSPFGGNRFGTAGPFGTAGISGNSAIMNVSVSLTGALPPAPAPSTTFAQGYVQHYLSFIVTQDLCILPASTIESIVILNKLNVEKMSDLDSFESSVTANEALELLRVSFTSNDTLNKVFGTKVPGSSKKSTP